MNMRFFLRTHLLAILATSACGDTSEDGDETSDGTGVETTAADSTGGGETTAADSTGGETTGGDSTGADSTGGVDPRAYYDGEASAALGAAGNQSRCSTCHSDDGTATGYSGHTFQNIAYKDNYKGGAADLLGGVNACVTGWMAGEALTAESPEYLGLVEFMQSISDPAETTPNPIMPEVLADEAAYEAAYGGGDATAGAALFTTACGGCHGGALVVGSVAAPGAPMVSMATAGRIAQQVRTSGPPPSGMSDAMDTTPGPMPFFELDELSQQELADIIAFIKAPA